MAAWRNRKNSEKARTKETGNGEQNSPIPRFADTLAEITNGTGGTEKAFENLVAAAAQAGHSFRELAVNGDLLSNLPPASNVKLIPKPVPPQPPSEIITIYFVNSGNVYTGLSDVSVHIEAQCRGQQNPCCIHSPSDHHMKEWPQLWNAVTRVMFRRCPHNIWHPDFDHLAHTEMRWGYEKAETEANHDNCDGCCERIFF